MRRRGGGDYRHYYHRLYRSPLGVRGYEEERGGGI